MENETKQKNFQVNIEMVQSEVKGKMRGKVKEEIQEKVQEKIQARMQPTSGESVKYKRGLVWLFASALAFCILIMTLVIVVDPFFHYHKPLKGFPYLVDNQLSQNPGMAKHMDYDSVILGSSMTVNFQTDWFRELMGLHTLKLSYSGAYPKDQSNIMKIIFDGDHQVKKAFLGVDVITYMGDTEETKYPIPEYLYDKSLINDVQYVLNKDVLLNYILRQVGDPEPTNLSNVYASWWTDEYYSEDWVLRGYTSPEKVEEEAPADLYLAGTEKNLEINICPFIEANPDTEFVIFFPPYSILFWNDVVQENHLQATLEEYRLLANRLNAYDNVTVYFFPDQEDIVLDLNHYADYSHYHPRYNRWMAECFANGDTGLVAKDEELAKSQKDGKSIAGKSIDEYLNHMENIVENFDFEEVLSRKP